MSSIDTYNASRSLDRLPVEPDNTGMAGMAAVATLLAGVALGVFITAFLLLIAGVR